MDRKNYLLIIPPIYEVSLDYLVKTLTSTKRDYIFIHSLNNISHSPGLLRIASFLKAEGNNVSLINCLADEGRNVVDTLGPDYVTPVKYMKCGHFENEHVKFKQFRIGISKDKILRLFSSQQEPDEIYITSFMTYHYRGVKEIVEYCKASFPKAKITLGGIYASLCPEHAQSLGIDHIHRGIHHGADDYPADYDLLGCKPDFVIIKASRGCPKNCAYCAVHILEGHTLKFRNLDLVFDEIRHKVNKYGINRITFWESNILVNSKNYFEKILDFLISDVIPIRPDLELSFPEALDASLVYPALLAKLKKAGAKKLIFALETIDTKLLKRFNRRTNLQNVYDAVRMAVMQGYESSAVHVHILAGLPDQSLSSILDSCIKVLEIGAIPKMLYYTPIPGTEEYKRYYGAIKSKDLEELHPYLFPFASDELPVKILAQLLIFWLNANLVQILDSLNIEPRLKRMIRHRIGKSKILSERYCGKS